MRSASLPESFALYPAIDLRGGRCVRLEQGDAARGSQYAADPIEQARAYAAAGARWVHVVDLDAAFGTGSNRDLVREIAASTSLAVQTGGGLRSEDDVADVLDRRAAARAVLGTVALERPELVHRCVERWGPERIAVGLDARGRHPAARGWTAETSRDLFAVGREMATLGVRTLIHTDIERDGMFTGPNLELAEQLARESGCEVIVSGGVRDAADAEHAAQAAVRTGGAIAGLIIGKALYERRLDLAATLAALP